MKGAAIFERSKKTEDAEQTRIFERSKKTEDAEQTRRLGHPSYVWRAGQERRLEMVRKYVPLEGKKILDVGCGIGTYLQAFKRFTTDLYGVEIDKKRAEEATLRLRPSTGSGRRSGQEKVTPKIFVAPAEKLPFDDAAFDTVFSHEVLEHVVDDRKAVEEAVRVLKLGGHLVIFVPNRLFPFETHGFYWRGRYIFGNIPLINYLPNCLRNTFAPHVRAYTARDLKKLFEGLPVRFVVFTQIYPGFDKIFAKIPLIGTLLRQSFYFLEKTPLKIFGLSHFIITQKTK